MESRVAVIGIIVENRESVPTLNRLLSDYGDYIIGRMGVPYHKKEPGSSRPVFCRSLFHRCHTVCL